MSELKGWRISRRKLKAALWTLGDLRIPLGTDLSSRRLKIRVGGGGGRGGSEDEEASSSACELVEATGSVVGGFAASGEIEGSTRTVGVGRGDRDASNTSCFAGRGEGDEARSEEEASRFESSPELDESVGSSSFVG